MGETKIQETSWYNDPTWLNAGVTPVSNGSDC